MNYLSYEKKISNVDNQNNMNEFLCYEFVFYRDEMKDTVKVFSVRNILENLKI